MAGITASAAFEPDVNDRMELDVQRAIIDIKRELGIGMILVEHDMRVVMDLADTVLAIDFGKPIALGQPDQIQQNPDVIRAYLGQEHSVVETHHGDET